MNQPISQVRALTNAGKFGDAVEATLQCFGEELFGFINNLCPSRAVAEDAYSRFCESVLIGLPGFRWEASLRTWLYTLARNASFRERNDAFKLAGEPIVKHAHRLRHFTRTQTATFQRAESRVAIERLRAALSADERALLTLRVDRCMPFETIAKFWNLSKISDVPRLRSESDSSARRISSALRPSLLDCSE